MSSWFSRVKVVRFLIVIGCVLSFFAEAQVPTIRPTPKPSRKPTNKPIHIFGDEEPVLMTEKEKQGIVATLTVLLFILMALDFTGPEVLFLIALMIVCLAQILSLSETLSGFSNESMITIGALFLVIGAVEKSHVVDWLARKTFGSTGSDTFGKLRMYITCFCLSTFFNNTPLVAILMPVVKDWGRMRNISASQLLIPLSYAVLSGSFGSMIGTSTNLTVQGLMQVDRGYSFPFFAPLPIGVICFVALLIYMLIAGPFLLPKDRSGLLRKARDDYKEFVCEIYVSEHSQAVGKSLSVMMNSLGMAPSLAVKIRRHDVSQTPSGQPSDAEAATAAADQPIKKSASDSAFLDLNYIQENVKFWYAGKSNIPDRLGAYSSVDAPAAAEEATTAANPTSGQEYFDIISPSFEEIIRAGDVVFVASAQTALERMMKSILGESQGLYILQGNVMSLPGYGSELAEMVLSDSSPFIGRRVSDISKDFSDRYKAAIITVRPKDFGGLGMLGHQDENYEEVRLKDGEKSNAATLTTDDVNKEGLELSTIEAGAATPAASTDPVGADSTKTGDTSKAEKKEEELAKHIKSLHSAMVISEHVLAYGDTVLAVTSRKNLEDLTHNPEFFVVSGVGLLPKPLDFYTFFPVLVFVTMLVLVASEMIEMCPAALTVTAFFFMGGWLVPQDIPRLVDLRLLMLMGCSLSFAKSMTTSGLAVKIAESINDSNPSPFGALLLVYVITLVITELISNNAAAALMYPLAVALADEMGLSFKSFAMAVLVASTAGFMSPIGYQTHVMVWGPGGYKFGDFLIFGIVPDLIYWFVGCAMITVLFPLHDV